MSSWISKMYSNMKNKLNTTSATTAPVGNVPPTSPPHSSASYTRSSPHPTLGTMYYDTNLKSFMIYDGTSWRKSITVLAKSERKSLLDELDKKDYSDILETVLLILMRNNLVSDINEFREILDAAKLARQITDGEETL